MSTERNLDFKTNITEASEFDWKHGLSKRLGLDQADSTVLRSEFQTVLFRTSFQERLLKVEISLKEALLSYPSADRLANSFLTGWLIRPIQRQLEQKQEQLRSLIDNAQSLVSHYEETERYPLIVRRARTIELAANALAAQVIPRATRGNVVKLQVYEPDQEMLDSWSEHWKKELASEPGQT